MNFLREGFRKLSCDRQTDRHDRNYTDIPRRLRVVKNEISKVSTFSLSASWHRRNNRRDRGRLVPQLLGWGPTMYWSPNFLAVVFKKQEIPQQVVTRMQDLPSEFS